LTDTDLIQLAGAVVSRLRLTSSDSETVQDCFQIAYLSGLASLRRKQKKGGAISRRYLMLAMQKTVYRQLKKSLPISIDVGDDESDLPFILEHEKPQTARDQLEVRDLLATYSYSLTAKQLTTVQSFLAGQSISQIAKQEKIAVKTVKYRLGATVKNLRTEFELSEL
jgi:DNA-directed RNA polymerase specialized sigma24 family protein